MQFAYLVTFKRFLFQLLIQDFRRESTENFCIHITQSFVGWRIGRPFSGGSVVLGNGLCKNRNYTCTCLRWQISLHWNFFNPSRATPSCLQSWGLQEWGKGPPESVNGQWFSCTEERCPALQCAWLYIGALPHLLQTLAGGTVSIQHYCVSKL